MPPRPEEAPVQRRLAAVAHTCHMVTVRPRTPVHTCVHPHRYAPPDTHPHAHAGTQPPTHTHCARWGQSSSRRQAASGEAVALGHESGLLGTQAQAARASEFLRETGKLNFYVKYPDFKCWLKMLKIPPGPNQT